MPGSGKVHVTEPVADIPVPASWRPTSLAVAQWCAGQGWPVHPLAVRSKTPPANCHACQDPRHRSADCECPAAGRWCHGFHAATTEAALIDRWWSVNPAFGVGVSCGPAGLVVIDVDAHDVPPPARDRVLPGVAIHDQVDLSGLSNGFHTLGILAALRGAADPVADESTLRVRTPSGGMHIWYRAPQGRRYLCSSGSSTGRALAWQVDVRSVGGYIVAPGTVTSAGVYEPVGPARVPAVLPEWLAVELARTGHLEGPAPQQIPAGRVVPARGRQAGPSAVASVITSASRSGSMGGFVTCAKSWWK